MGHVVLWACSLATALLLVATLLAVTVRWPRRYGQTFWPILAGALVLALACAASVLAGYLEFRERLDVSRFYPVVVWTALYLAGSATVLVGGLRRREGAAAASGWRRGPLAAALAGITL